MEIDPRSALFSLALLASCAGEQWTHARNDYSTSDDFANKRFVLKFRNEGNRLLCLSPATWPNINGNIPMTSAEIYVSVGDKVFPLNTFIEDCFDCSTRVRPKETVVGYLNYSTFKIPSGLFGSEKRLHLIPSAAVCDLIN